MTTPLIQVAFDRIDFYETLRLAEQVAPHVDILEIGAACIKHNGIQIVQALRKRFTKHKILVDLKTMSAGEHEATPFYAAGANICTVLGIASSDTIRGVVSAANGYGAEVLVDLMNVSDKLTCARQAVEAGAKYLGVRSGLGGQAQNQTPLADLRDLAELNLRTKISVAGGIDAGTAPQFADAGADIIVVGAAIYAASSPAEAAQQLRNSLSEVPA